MSNVAFVQVHDEAASGICIAALAPELQDLLESTTTDHENDPTLEASAV